MIEHKKRGDLGPLFYFVLNPNRLWMRRHLCEEPHYPPKQTYHILRKLARLEQNTSEQAPFHFQEYKPKLPVRSNT